MIQFFPMRFVSPLLQIRFDYDKVVKENVVNVGVIFFKEFFGFICLIVIWKKRCYYVLSSVKVFYIFITF